MCFSWIKTYKVQHHLVSFSLPYFKHPIVLVSIWVFPKIGVPQNGWFIMETPIKMDGLGVYLFLETAICTPGSSFFLFSHLSPTKGGCSHQDTKLRTRKTRQAIKLRVGEPVELTPVDTEAWNAPELEGPGYTFLLFSNMIWWDFLMTRVMVMSLLMMMMMLVMMVVVTQFSTRSRKSESCKRYFFEILTWSYHFLSLCFCASWCPTPVIVFAWQKML